jgi:hypothetical protein
VAVFFQPGQPFFGWNEGFCFPQLEARFFGEGQSALGSFLGSFVSSADFGGENCQAIARSFAL